MAATNFFKTSYWCHTSLWSRPVINNQYFIDMWLQHSAKGFVCRMRQVHSTVLFTGEAQKKTMRKVLVQPFRTVVGAPFQRFYFFYLVRQCTKGVFHFLDVGSRGAVLEFKEHHMA